jgi:subtilisin family serine protease/subtilisin-like proprotein convertase family protein
MNQWLGWICLWIAVGAGALLAQASDPPAIGGTRFQFREPHHAAYTVEVPAAKTATQSLTGDSGAVWLKAWPVNGSKNFVEFGNRVVIQLTTPGELKSLLADRALRVARVVTENTFILEARDTLTALREAEALGRLPGVQICQPVARRQARRHDLYARRPNDPYFYRRDLPPENWQWHLENRDDNGTQLGIDLNIRAAWALSRGTGVTIAIADDGFEMEHPDLAPQTAGAPHFNFHTLSTRVGPSGRSADHATAVAGLAAAKGDNRIGISGVAPEARLANWVVFNSFDALPSDETMMDMFQYKSNVVSVQNHSWGKVGADQLRVSALEQIGISNAVHFGRGGLGAIIVRSAGNGRGDANSANDDAYPSDPGVIAVAAARFDGKVARYSNPGACILVAAPSGDDSSEVNPCITNSPNLFTTDRQGASGYNQKVGTEDDLANYGFADTGFSGTSAAAPQISGLAALVLAANPTLGYRDVQQILALSGRHFDLTDPDLVRNGAGFLISHNLGFGVPDAGAAVSLARNWKNRPPLVTVTYSNTNITAIPDLGMRVLIEGANVPRNLASIPALPGSGIHPDQGTVSLPLTDVGPALDMVSEDLRGHAALIQRGTAFFCDKIAKVTQAGAAFAVVYNNKDATQRIVMGGIDFATIPAVMVSQQDGEALSDYLQTDPTARVRLNYTPVRYAFNVPESLACEHVGVRLDTDHTRRGDLRVTLISPMGTRSVLQFVNADDAAGPVDWSYYSTHHFFESSAGTWTVEIGDEDDKGMGNVTSLDLVIRGVPITDTDHDGLDDRWEMDHFHTLAYGPMDDPDHDGIENAREQAMGSDPATNETPLHLDLTVWDEHLVRLSWPGDISQTYQVRLGVNSPTPLTTTTNIPGRFPVTEWFAPYSGLPNEFFRVRALPPNR